MSLKSNQAVTFVLVLLQFEISQVVKLVSFENWSKRNDFPGLKIVEESISFWSCVLSRKASEHPNAFSLEDGPSVRNSVCIFFL